MVASSPWLNHSLQCSKTAFFLTHSSKTAVRIYARFYSNGFYRGRSSPDPFFPPNTRAVDFQLTEAQAKEAFFEWHGSNIFAPSELHGGYKVHVKSTFLPFWLFRAVVRGEYSAVFSKPRPISFGNAKIRNVEWRQIDWTPFKNALVLEESNEEMQIFASFNFRRRYAQVLRGEHAVRCQQQLNQDLVKNGLRDIEAFQISEQLAKSFLNIRLDDIAKKAAVEEIQAMYASEAVHNVRVRLEICSLTATPVYLPCYVMEYHYFGSGMVG